MPANVQSRVARATPHVISSALCLLLLLFCSATTLAANEDRLSEPFPRGGFEGRIEFWKQIFTRYGERDVVFHDQGDLRLIYEVVSFEKSARSDAAEALRRSVPRRGNRR